MKLYFILLLCLNLLLASDILSQTNREVRSYLYAVNADNSNMLCDGTLTAYDDSYSNSIDAHDAKKMANFTENFGLLRTPVLLTIERRHTIELNDTIFYKMWLMQQRAYKLQIVAKNMNYPGLSGILEDTYLKTKTPVDLNDTTSVTFNITSDEASSAPERFRIIYAFPVEQALPLMFSNIKTYQQNDNMAIEWKVENEISVKQYNIERSSNGQQFSIAGTIPAILNKSGNATYQWLDKAAVYGDNFYRITSVDNEGKVQYSDISKIEKAQKIMNASVFPNPVKNDILNINLPGIGSGNYTYRIISLAGKISQSGQVSLSSHLGVIKLSSYIASGSYRLQLSKNDHLLLNQNILVQ